MILKNYNEYKKEYEKDCQTILSFAQLYRKSLQDDVIDKSVYQSLRNIFTKSLAETRNQYFL